MSLIADIKTLIPAEAAAQSDVYLGDQPDSPDNVVVLYHSGGFPPSHSFDGRDYEEPTFQVRIRNESFSAAETAAETIKDALDGRAEITINGHRYIIIQQLSDILPLGKDSRKRTELSINFRARVAR